MVIVDADQMESEGPDWFGRLIGVRSSKPRFYREFRHTSESLARSIRALEPVSRTLTTLTGGPHRVAEEVVRAVADIFSADGVALLVTHPAFGDGPFALLAVSDHAAEDGAPSELLAVVESFDGDCADEQVLVAPISWHDKAVGRLAARLPEGRRPDDTDAAILRTLAYQTAAAIETSRLYAESERLRDEATKAYEAMAERARDLEIRNRQLRAARSALAAARDQQTIADERQRIARELHDSVAQHVLSIGLNIEWCRTTADDPALVDRLTMTKELARDAVTHIRQSIFELSLVGHDGARGLPDALRRLAGDELGSDGPRTSVRVEGRPFELPESTEHGLYMIAREALFNAVLHGEATSVSLRLVYDADTVSLAVSDDGSGDAEDLRRRLAAGGRRRRDGHGCGLANMAHRAREMGGALRLSRSRRGGVRVSVTVPRTGAGE